MIHGVWCDNEEMLAPFYFFWQAESSVASHKLPVPSYACLSICLYVVVTIALRPKG
jgi:hypothetical protein